MKDNQHMIEEINKHLVGAMILGAIESEGDDYFNDFGFMISKGGKKMTVWVQQDPEGNGPGWLAIENENGGKL